MQVSDVVSAKKVGDGVYDVSHIELPGTFRLERRKPSEWRVQGLPLWESSKKKALANIVRRNPPRTHADAEREYRERLRRAETIEEIDEVVTEINQDERLVQGVGALNDLRLYADSRRSGIGVYQDALENRRAVLGYRVTLVEVKLNTDTGEWDIKRQSGRVIDHTYSEYLVETASLSLEAYNQRLFEAEIGGFQQVAMSSGNSAPISSGVAFFRKAEVGPIRTYSGEDILDVSAPRVKLTAKGVYVTDCEMPTESTDAIVEEGKQFVRDSIDTELARVQELKRWQCHADGE